MRPSGPRRRSAGFVAPGLLVATIALVMTPGPADGQGADVAVGVLVGEEILEGRRAVAPMVSATFGVRVAGIPVLLEAGYARYDFTSFGEAFHRNYGAFVLGSEWMPVRGRTSAGFRLGVGAVVEDDINEDDDAFRSSNNWAGGVVPALVVERTLVSGRSVVFIVSDHVLGGLNAILDPEEYGIEHRVRVLLGIRF